MRNEKKTKTLAIFQGKNIRRTWHHNQWWFVIADVVQVLTNSKDPKRYLKDIRRRDEELGKGWGQFATPLPVETTGGEQQLNCANTRSMFRIIQSIPSKNAEPFKRWLAKVGADRINEIESPELSIQRVKQTYKAKGYDNKWIDKRLRSMTIRQELVGEWGRRGVVGKGFGILTNEIMKAAFDMSVDEYKKYKHLNKDNLRDHMDDVELVLTMLGEAATTTFTREHDNRDFQHLKKDAQDGGDVAGRARENIEQQIGKSVITKQNYLKKEGVKEIETL
jgi:DNA-damage-inducible protein D